jgi:hypothetical protein
MICLERRASTGMQQICNNKPRFCEVNRRVIHSRNSIARARSSKCVFCLLRIILPKLEQCRKFPIKLGEIFLSEEEEFLNYSQYFKNMPHQTKLMEDGGIEFFAVSFAAVTTRAL